MRLGLHPSQDSGEIKMKALRTFFMEDWLESFRFKAKYNLGESGGRPRKVKDLIHFSDLQYNDAFYEFMEMKLCDSPNRGREDLRKIIAQFHPGAEVENVLITTGTSEALFLLFRHLKPKKIALAMPAFQLLYELPLALNSEIISLPIRYNEIGKPFIDEKEWLDIINTEKPDCLLINNPHNPSGIILKKEFLNNLSDTANKIGCHIIGDEHYRFLSSQNEILGDTIYKRDENTFVTGSFIKCLGVPGLRIGWCVGPKKALDALQNEKNYTTHTVNPITEWLSYEVLKNTNSNLFKIIKKEWIENKAILNEFLSNSKTIYGISPEGGLVTSLGFKNSNSMNETNKLTEILLKNGIFTLPLSSMEFGTLDFQNLNSYKNNPLSNINKGYGFRLGLGIETHLFSQALKEIEEALT